MNQQRQPGRRGAQIQGKILNPRTFLKSVTPFKKKKKIAYPVQSYSEDEQGNFLN